MGFVLPRNFVARARKLRFKGHSLFSLRISRCCQVQLVDPIITNPCKRVVLRYKGLKGAISEYST